MNTAAFYIFQTTDGAQHWHRQFSVMSTLFAPPWMKFFDPSHGFVNLDRLYRTTDGGEHWNVISVPDAAPDFAFADANHGWAYDGVRLYATRDGGLTWQIAGSLPSDKSGEGFFPELSFRADGEGWIGSSSPEPVVYTTRDGGATWRSIQLPAFPPTAIGGKPTFISTFVWLTPGGVLVRDEDGFGQSRFYTSNDVGRSWQSIEFPANPQFPTTFSFLDSRHWWISNEGILYTTGDAGRSWKTVSGTASDNIGDWGLGPASAIDSRHGWCVITSPNLRNSASGLAMTSDGGRHWAPVNVPIPPA